jgi:hypothetical protein
MPLRLTALASWEDFFKCWLPVLFRLLWGRWRGQRRRGLGRATLETGARKRIPATDDSINDDGGGDDGDDTSGYVAVACSNDLAAAVGGFRGPTCAFAWTPAASGYALTYIAITEFGHFLAKIWVLEKQCNDYFCAEISEIGLSQQVFPTLLMCADTQAWDFLPRLGKVIFLANICTKSCMYAYIHT